MPYKNGGRMRDFWAFLFLLSASLLTLVRYEMIIANLALRASLAIYHLISNACP